LVKLVKKTKTAQPDSLPHVHRMVVLAADRKALRIRAYDVRGLTLVADYFIMCSASSEPHFKAVFNGIREGMKEIGLVPMHTEGRLRGGWLLLDYGTIILHVFREEARDFYDLDGLWADAPQVALDVDTD